MSEKMFKHLDEFVEYLNTINFQSRLDKLKSKYKNKKIVVYGAGTLFEAISLNYDLSDFNIIAVSDMKFIEDTEYKGYKAIPSEEILNYKPDVVLVAIFDSTLIEDYFLDEYFPQFGKFKYEFFVKQSFIESIKELIRAIFN